MARKRRRKDWKNLSVPLIRTDRRTVEDLALALDLAPGPMGRSIVLAAIAVLAEMRAELGDEHFRAYVNAHGLTAAIENYRTRRPGTAFTFSLGRRIHERPIEGPPQSTVRPALDGAGSEPVPPSNPTTPREKMGVPGHV